MQRSELRKKKKSKKRTIFYTILIIVSSFIILAGTYAVYLTKKAELAANKSYEQIEERESGSSLREDDVEPLEDNISILLIGIDDSEKRNFGDSNSRSDSMVATLNNEDKSVKLVSIPRDTFTYIPEVGYEDKITHAHAYGGTIAAIETVENLLDIPIDYYVKMNFEAFIDVVDALDGVVVDVPYDRLE